MRTLTFIGSKGGCGKTTSAAFVAVAAARAGEKVALVDLDPQASLSLWWDRRDDADNPRLSEGADPQDLTKAVDFVKRAGSTLLIIDTAPAFLGALAAVACVSDLIVIPVMASPQDLEGVDPAVQIARRHKRPFVFLLNRVHPKGGPLNEGVAKALAQEGKLLDVQIADRLAHPAAMTEGKTAAEVDKASQREATKLWKALDAVLAATSPAPSKRATVIR
jgi:chromosome partitioning protein